MNTAKVQEVSGFWGGERCKLALSPQIDVNFVYITIISLLLSETTAGVTTLFSHFDFQIILLEA